MIVHDYNTAWKVIAQLIPCISASGSPFEQVTEVQEMCIEKYVSETKLQAKGKEVARVVCPEELLRYPPEETAKRARERAGRKEKWYDLVKNNCETLIMWCFCDLQISLQETDAVRYIREVIGGGYNFLKHALQQVPKALVELCGDDIILLASKVKPVATAFPKGILAWGGALVTIFAEGYLAYREIKSAKQKWKEGIVIKTRKEFIMEVIDSVLSAPFRAGGSIGGMIVGQLLIPIPVLGGIIQAVLGYLSGHCTSKLLTEFGLTEYLAEHIDNWLSPDKPADKLDKERSYTNESAPFSSTYVQDRSC